MTENEKMLPSYWISPMLGEVCQTTSGGTPSRKNPSFYEGNIPWVKSGELNYNIIFETEEHISEEAIKTSSAKVFPKDTLLIALYGATIGKLAFLGVDAATNQAVCAIFKNKIFESKFLYYFLFHRRQDLIKEAIGGAQPNISQTILKNLEVPICPLPEQRAIVSKIEQLFSELDNGISNLKLAQAQLKVYRQAVLKKAFEGELTKKWREQQTDLLDAEDLLEQIKKKRQETTKISSKKQKSINSLTENELAELPKIPEKWKWVKTADIIDPINNGYTPKANFLSSGSGEVPFIKVYNLNFDGSFNFQKYPTFIPKIIHQKELARSITCPGDVLINIVGPPLGKVSIVSSQFPEWNINQAIVLFRPNKWVTTKIISYYLQNPKTIQWLENTSKATAGQFNVKVSTCREIPFPLFYIEEQHAIVKEIETRLSVCDKIEQDIKDNLERAEALRQSILKKAFEGKLLNERELAEVRKAEDWESAEVLLERIRKEKVKK